MRKLSSAAVMAALGLATSFGCSTESSEGTTTIDLSLSGLEALDEGAYEGWLIYGEEKVSTGVFTRGDRAQLSTDRDVAAADKFVITIEPTPDADPAPSGVIVLAGDIATDGKTASLSFPVDLSAASGGYILKTPTDDATNVQYEIDLSMVGLEDLTEGAYEGWLIVGEDKISTGTFTTGAGATMTSATNPADASMFVVTIEPTPDADPAPSGVVVLAGAIQNGEMATLAFGADLTQASGGFILRTPTDDMTDPMNDEAGVWFLEMGMNGMMAGLNLPALPDGWVYEGWGVTQGVPLTTGRFVDTAAADLDSPYSDGGPPFPGEDFVMNLPAEVTPPVDLTDGNSLVVISVEPDMAGVDPTGAAPFAIKPLAVMVPQGAPTATFTMLGAGPVVTVSGSVSFTAVPVDNDSAGVWFLEIGANGPQVGLDLPALGDGWVYEGWAVTQGTPLSTGRFTMNEGADLASPYSDGGPPFPGEDFVMNLPDGITAVDLADGNSMIVISVEPDVNGSDPTGDGPFALKPLAGAVPAGLVGGTFTTLGAGPVGDASGSATFTAAE